MDLIIDERYKLDGVGTLTLVSFNGPVNGFPLVFIENSGCPVYINLRLDSWRTYQNPYPNKLSPKEIKHIPKKEVVYLNLYRNPDGKINPGRTTFPSKEEARVAVEEATFKDRFVKTIKIVI